MGSTKLLMECVNRADEALAQARAQMDEITRIAAESIGVAGDKAALAGVDVAEDEDVLWDLSLRATRFDLDDEDEDGDDPTDEDERGGIRIV